MAGLRFDVVAPIQTKEMYMDAVEEFIPSRDDVEAALADPEKPAGNDNPELNVLTPEERAIVAKILPGLTARIRGIAEADSARSLAERTKELIAQNTKMMEDEVKKLRDSIKPPDEKQLAELLAQEYGTMDVPVVSRKGVTKTFTLRELPQSCEKKMFDIIKVKIVPHMKELAAAEWSASSTGAERLQKVLDIVPDGLDMLADVCAICLDPYKEEGVDRDWVQANMGSSRIINVVDAQMTISKIRDFGSAVYRLLPR